MSFQERRSSETSRTETRPFTGMVHRFKSPLEFLQVKGMEIGSNVKNLLAEAFNKNRMVPEEGCFNRLCGAPPSAHVFAGSP
jgi:hypothetical protein